MKTIKKIFEYVFWITITIILTIMIFTFFSKNILNNVVEKKDKSLNEIKIIEINEKNITNIIADLPSEKKYNTRKKSDINTIIIHCTDGAFNKTPYEVAQIGIDNFGFGHSYHYQIDSSGTIFQTNWLISITAHCKENNTHSIGIVLDGQLNDYKPTQKQLESLVGLCRYLLISIPSIENIYGHNHYNDNKSCPGKYVDVDKIKKYIYSDD